MRPKLYQLEIALDTFAIAEIEQAINYWRARQIAGEDCALWAEVRLLADVYGLMIFRRANSIEASKLDDDLLDVIGVALNQRELPP
ncbi:DUF3717 domain-containing protein [Paraburkholderia guartelaensis]|uniref:DUF3717 domain-containing protein n=1 Tax=Paraburkholderia guartelaensis TaxID=2546446 RepID=UPI001FE64A8A|nr:DUF3717 domain-containing protein [Paraburkholderia guartelaensis]